MFLAIFLLILLATLSYKYLIPFLPWTTNIAPLSPPPGPNPLPFIGNLHQFDFSTLHLCFAKLGKKYGPILGLKFGCRSVVVIQSSEMAKEVLQIQDINFCGRPSMVGIQKLTYNGIDIVCSPYNEYFKEMKKLSVVHLLSSKRVQSFGHIRQDEILRLVNKISTLSSASKIVNLSELVLVFSSSNVCRMAFGKRYDDDEEGQRSRFHDLLNAAQAAFTTFFFSDYFPSMGWLDHLCGQHSRIEKTFKQLDAFFEEMINDHLDPNRPKSDHEDIIDVLLHLKRDRYVVFDLSINHIKALLMDIFVAGTDTSASMVVWAMTLLIKNPAIMKNVQEEIRNATQDKAYINEEDVQTLAYFKAVVKETFRLHPAAPLLVVHESTQKTKLNGFDILPKTLVHVNVWAIGRDPKTWKDPEKFMPERFMSSSIDLKGQHFELVPFGAGRRICPGLNLGLANMELTLANLLKNFDWDLPAGMMKEDIDTNTLPGITMHKKNPLNLLARKFSGPV